MSLPQIQTQLFGRPARLAGLAGTLRNGGTIAAACRPIASSTLSHPLDVLQPGCISGNLEVSMSSSRDAFLGHACVSPAGLEDHSTPDLETCASTNLGYLIQGAVA